MSDRSITLKIPLNYPTILIFVLIIHALMMISFRGEVENTIGQAGRRGQQKEKITIRNIKFNQTPMQKIRTAGVKDGKKNSFAPIEKARKGEITPLTKDQTRKKPLSLGDLAQTKVRPPQKVQRAGTRPEVLPLKTKSLNAISLRGSQIQEFTSGASAKTLSGDPRSKSLDNSDILVNLEVPEGVDPDELNKYEMMFYGFQRRTAINYINSFYKHLDKFQRENPHLHFPSGDNKHVMTGRMTFDDKGNVKQIKMIRWSNDAKTQGFFEEVLKEMDTLHNPPQALWKRDGEFSIFFSLVLNG